MFLLKYETFLGLKVGHNKHYNLKSSLRMLKWDGCPNITQTCCSTVYCWNSWHIPSVFLPSIPESPQLSSSLSTSEHNQANVDFGLGCYSQPCVESLDGEGERPVSLVSTLSSGSSRDSRSLFGSTVALPSSTTPPIQSEEDIDLELSPAEGTREQTLDQSPTLTGSRVCWQERLPSTVISIQSNSNIGTSNRKGGGEIPYIPASPVITDAMAPNPKLTYVDRVVMEIIETERMYVKDLRSIVEVSKCQGFAFIFESISRIHLIWINRLIWLCDCSTPGMWLTEFSQPGFKTQKLNSMANESK